MGRRSIRKWVNGERKEIEVQQQKMRTLDPDQQESYKFPGVEQADGIKTKEDYERVRGEVKRKKKNNNKVRTYRSKPYTCNQFESHPNLNIPNECIQIFKKMN